MKTLALLTLALLLAGCATDNEDRAFFNEGWLNPDEAANRRMYGPRVPPSPENSSQPAAR
jgi:hypothetical protein